MKITQILFSILLATLYVAPIQAEDMNAHQMAISSANHCIEESRQAVWELGHQNPLVKQQYNRFANNLRKVYQNGEGLIDKDIYRILEGAVFAAESHQFQVRKDPDHTPYIVHPIGVANHLLEIGHVRDPDILIAALLHDTVEDTDTSFDDIEEHFGVRIRDFVAEVTDDKDLPKEERKQLQIKHAPHKSAGAAQIKLGDKLFNLNNLNTNPPIDWEKERIDQYFIWAENVVNNLPWVNAALKKAVDEEIALHWNR